MNTTFDPRCPLCTTNPFEEFMNMNSLRLDDLDEEAPSLNGLNEEVKVSYHDVSFDSSCTSPNPEYELIAINSMSDCRQ